MLTTKDTYSCYTADIFANRSATAEECYHKDYTAQYNDQDWDKIRIYYINDIRNIAYIVDHKRTQNDEQNATYLKRGKMSSKAFD